MALAGLSGKVVVVTGAAGGIGRATVRRLLAEGCRVAGVDLDAGRTAAAIGADPGAAFLPIGADVASEDGAADYVARTVARFGRLDGLVNNAGILGRRLPLVEMPVAEFDRILAVNLRGVFLGMQAALRRMHIQGGGGAIVNLSSIGALKTFRNSAGYGTSKNAVLSLTRVAALENLDRNIRVSAVCPGMTDTPMLHESIARGLLGGGAGDATVKMAKPEEIANVIAFLLSDEASFVTGSTYIHKAQGMTVDRTYVLATPGMDAHGSYVALSRHRDGMDLHYGRDDFAGQDSLINTLSRDRAKDMATDYEQQIDPAQDYAERRGIASHARDAAIEQIRVPSNAVDRIDDIIFGVRELRDGSEGPERETTGRGIRQEIEAVVQEAGIDSEDALRHARRMALIRHAHAVGQVFNAEDAGGKGKPRTMGGTGRFP